MILLTAGILTKTTTITKWIKIIIIKDVVLIIVILTCIGVEGTHGEWMSIATITIIIITTITTTIIKIIITITF